MYLMYVFVYRLADFAQFFAVTVLKVVTWLKMQSLL